MKCPDCKIDVMGMELAGVKIDYCIKCEGIWLSKEKLEKLFDQKKLREFFSTLKEKEQEEKNSKCPVCRQKMSLKSTPHNTDLKFKICPEKHGIWLNKNELLKLLSSTELDKDNNILLTLKNMFV
ncbi:MAG: zf-TFIIB domain-containing protein [Bacillota bacterium]